MKIRGKKVQGACRDFIVIPRGDGVPAITLYAQAVLDTDLFNKLCPEPEPPSKILKGGVREYDFNDKDYQAATIARGAKYMAFTILYSLNLPENELEWEEVKLTDHRTWTKYKDELKNASFSPMEIKLIENLTYRVNCLSEGHLEEARANFLRTQAEVQERSSGPLTELVNTLSGKPANDLESSLQDLSIAPESAGTS